MKPRKMFIGSSTGYINLAKALRTTFEHDKDLQVQVWEVAKWPDNYDSLTALISFLDKFQFGAFLLTPDDSIQLANSKGIKAIPRDNVIFELGLWFGRAGRDRTWYLVPSDCDLKLPTDLAGLNTLKYRLPDPKEYKDGSVADFVPMFATCHDTIADNIRSHQKRAGEPAYFLSQVRRLQDRIKEADETEAIELLVDGIRWLLLERSVLAKTSITDTLRDVLVWTKTLLDGLDMEQLAEAQEKVFDAVWVFAAEPLETMGFPGSERLRLTVIRNIFEHKVKYTYFVHDQHQAARIKESLNGLAQGRKHREKVLKECVTFVHLPEALFTSYFTLHFCKGEVFVYQSVIRDNRDDFIVRLDENRSRTVQRLIEASITVQLAFDTDFVGRPNGVHAVNASGSN